MTVYADDWRQSARVGRINGVWCHLSVGPDDDLAELHAFAARIGLRRAWFQDQPWPRAHHDVTESTRRQAIRRVAVAITWREAGRQMREALARAKRSQRIRQYGNAATSQAAQALVRGLVGAITGHDPANPRRAPSGAGRSLGRDGPARSA